MDDGRRYQLALTQVGDVQAKLLVQHLGSARAVLQTSMHKKLEALRGACTGHQSFS